MRNLLFPLVLCLSLAAAAPLAAQIEDLESTDVKIRKKAVQSLGEKGKGRQGDTKTICDSLAKVVRDPAQEIREEAVIALIKTGTSDCQVGLEAATKDAAPEIQSLAVDGLVNFYSPGYVKFGWLNSVKSFGKSLKNRFREREPLLIDPYVKVSPSTQDAIAPLITGGSSMESRANAARASGILHAERSIPKLKEGLRAADKEIVVESIRSLGKIRDTSVGPDMAFLLVNPSEDIQVAAAETLGNLRTKEAVPSLVELARSGKKDVQRAALTSLAKIPDNGEEKLFLLFLNDKDAKMRGAAAEGIGRSGNEDDLKLIQDSFATEKSESARLSMAFAAVHLGDLNMVQYLVDGLDSTFHRLEARPFLVELARDPKVLSELYTPLTSGTRDQKIHLSTVIATSGTKDSIPHLERATNDADSRVAQAAITALKNLQARVG